jgi:3-oxoacyl-[acyl-carrier-protein] synthase II
LQPTGLADIAEAVAIEFAMTGPRLTVSAACASGLVALIRATLMIRSGEAQRVLIVSAESSLHPLFLASYQRLGVLSPDGSGCRPFDRSRAGFFVSEAAAAILLEASNPESPGGGVNVDNFALGADATHITGLDENATTLRTLLRRAIAGRPVDLIHAHATGTPLNDSVELAAIDDAMANQPNPPAVYSHKAAIGHTLGPSGLISVALNSLAHAKSIVPPNMRTHDPLTTRHVTISQAIGQRPIQRSLVIAAGFGGPVAVVSLSTNCHPADTPIP